MKCAESVRLALRCNVAAHPSCSWMFLDNNPAAGSRKARMHVRAWLAHGACKFYRSNLRQLPPRLARVLLVLSHISVIVLYLLNTKYPTIFVYAHSTHTIDDLCILHRTVTSPPWRFGAVQSCPVSFQTLACTEPRRG